MPPGGPAPAAQMVVPAAPMQTPTGQNGSLQQQAGQMPGQQQQGGPRPISPPQPASANDVLAFRQNVPQAAALTDEQVRDQIWAKRRGAHGKLVQAQQQQEALRHAQRTQQQGQQGQQGGMGGMGAQGLGQRQKGGMPQQQQQRPGQVGQGQGQKRPQQGGGDDE
ncbi:hypothetical protein LTR53_019006, partial [Teratosphaeriaceae sp. CCFEE 6253]